MHFRKTGLVFPVALFCLAAAPAEDLLQRYREWIPAELLQNAAHKRSISLTLEKVPAIHPRLVQTNDYSTGSEARTLIQGESGPQHRSGVQANWVFAPVLRAILPLRNRIELALSVRGRNVFAVLGYGVRP